MCQLPDIISPYNKSGELRFFHQQMQENKVIFYAEIEDIEPQTKTEITFNFNLTRGIALFPMLVGEDLIGFVGFKTQCHSLRKDDLSIKFTKDMASILAIFINSNKNTISQRRSDSTDNDFLARINTKGDILEISSVLTDDIPSASGFINKNALNLVKPRFRDRLREDFFEAIACHRKFIVAPIITKNRTIFYQIQANLVNIDDHKAIELYGHKIESIGY